MVATSPALQEALLLCSDIERQLVDVGRRIDPAFRVDLVRLRRRLAHQTGLVGQLIEQDEELARDPDKQQEMSRIFSAFRYALGHHQARWPVVSIGEYSDDYSDSARITYAKADAFWLWCANNLDFIRH